MALTNDWERKIEFVKIHFPDLFEKVKSACEEVDAEIERFNQFLYTDFIHECGKAFYEISHRGDYNREYEDLSDEERAQYEHDAEIAVLFKKFFD